MLIGSPCCILLCLVFILSFQETHSLRKIDQQLFLDLHNWYRARFTRDTYGDQPVAADMNAMDWDEYLAWKAKDIARRCIEPKKELLFISKEYSKQIGIVSFSKPIEDSQSTNDFLKSTFNNWIQNSTALKNDCDRSSVVCDNIKQILYSKTDKIGCAESLCQNDSFLKLLCLYNVRFNKSQPIFQHGEACSSCQENKPFCLDGSLCSSKTQCRKRNINSHCRCSINYQSCEPNGIFKLEECSCSCKPGYYGLACQDQCRDFHENCSRMQYLCFLNPTHRDYMIRNCRLTCGFCDIKNLDPVQSNPKRNLVINTVIDPMISEFSIDEHPRCKKLVGLCYTNYIQKHCPYTCGQYLKDMTEKVYESLGNIMIQDSMECVDINPNCPKWKEQNFCHIENIQQQCLQSCKMCANSGNSIICFESSEKKSACLRVKNLNLCTAPDMQKICPITCTNTKCHKKIFESGIGFQRSASVDEQIPQNEPPQCAQMGGICQNSVVLILCPKTCASRQLRILSLRKKSSILSVSSSMIPISDVSTISTSMSTEPQRCLSMRNFCSNSWITTLCKKTCSSTFTKRTSTRSAKTSTPDPTKLSSKRVPYHMMKRFPLVEPTYCSSMITFCNTASFANVCKITCGSFKKSPLTAKTSSVSSISGLTISFTTKMTEPKLCLPMRSFCTNPVVAKMCKMTCVSLISKKTSTMSSTVSSTIGFWKSYTYSSIEASLCSSMKDLCTIPEVSILCKRTCASSTASKLSTTSSSIYSTTGYIKSFKEPKFCQSMRAFCHNPSVAKFCKRTCKYYPIFTFSSNSLLSSSTIGTTKSFFRKSTEPSYCQLMKKFCTLRPVATTCERTCDEPAFCSSMTKLCYNPSVSGLCKRTCAHPKASKSSTISSSSSSKSSSMKLFSRLNNEPRYCLLMKKSCNVSAIAIICKIACGFHTTSTVSNGNSSKPSINRSLISLTTESPTLITEPIFCSSMLKLCHNPSVAKSCQKTCAYFETVKVSTSTSPSLTIRISSKSFSSMIIEPSYCKLMKRLCGTSSVAMICIETCAKLKTSEIGKRSSSASSTSHSTKLPGTLRTEPNYCKFMKKLCIAPYVADICKITCESLNFLKIYTTSSSIYWRTPSTILIREPTVCPSIKHLCISPYVANLCRMTCAYTTISLSNSTRFSKVSTFIIKEKSMCQDMKYICTNPGIARICNKTCAYSAATKHFSDKSSKGTTSEFSTLLSQLDDEPKKCPTLKQQCHNPTIYAKCKKTCAYLLITVSPTSSPSISPIPGSPKPFSPFRGEPSNCKQMKGTCLNPAVYKMCPKTCSSLPTAKWKTSHYSILPNNGSSKSFTSSIEPPDCTKMKDVCSNSVVAKICRKTCASSTVLKYKIRGFSTSSTNDFPTTKDEPSDCKQLKGTCLNPAVSKMCPKTCGSLPTAKWSTSFFSRLSNNSSSQSFTSSVEPSDCTKIKDVCSKPAVAKLCIKTCVINKYKTRGYSTSSTNKFSTATLSIFTHPFYLNNGSTKSLKTLTVEPPLCPTLKDLCLNPSVANTCKKTCASSSTSKFRSLATSQSLKTSKNSKNSSIGFQFSTRRPSKLLASTPNEPTICPSLRFLCTSPKVSVICRRTCGTILH